MLSRAASRILKNAAIDSSRWSAYKPRSGDIIIGTAPKVGTHWTLQIVSLLVFQSAEPRDLGFAPWLDAQFLAPLDEMLQMIESQAHRRILFSHLPFDAMPIYDEVQYIHVARDGRDVCMSLLNHVSNMTTEHFDRIAENRRDGDTLQRAMRESPREPREFYLYWIEAGTSDIDRADRADWFFETERSFWPERHRPNLLLVHFNDLKANLSGEMRHISAFLDIPVNEAIWPNLVEAATFDSMKRNGAQILTKAKYLFRGGHETFLHQGTNEQWRNVLTGADLELYEKRAHTALSPGLFNWLRNGRSVAGDPVLMPD
ncbi:MAG: sulfotransferase domain-containing protein [Deltaproteobacteria bacterium]|nr:sulfotransferase domain-containing protein [Deltaproteobacteria bacterium]